MNRISIVIKERVNTILDNHEDPREALDHSYVKQTEMLNKLRQDVAEVLTAKKDLRCKRLNYGTIFIPFMNRLDAHSI